MRTWGPSAMHGPSKFTKLKTSARVTTASMTEHAVACLVEEHAVWTKRGLEQGKGEVNRIEKGVFVNMFACIAGSVSHYKGCPFCVPSSYLYFHRKNLLSACRACGFQSLVPLQV